MSFNETACALENLQLKAGSVEPAEASDGKLCFAIEWDDSIVHPHPPIARELREVKERPLTAGRNAIDWVPNDRPRCCDIIGRVNSADCGEEIKRSCDKGGESVILSLVADGNEPKHLSTFNSRLGS
ncbi:Amidase signature domain protein [Kalmanozyma brasiliensis GHG001]|uniref:Uncharacterized protein n=1 Tax=Kalmanozyma brasiliensis (strain GHG001) TaxID=1365824 RepID=V5EQQ0_KALBG|nr:Amidase signature domain protein [Kalmanozyma brasiliensis GHG001]EST07475.1 Amidase signature domain protein [Kalmanozyma brasiliensis GHG001]